MSICQMLIIRNCADNLRVILKQDYIDPSKGLCNV